MNREQVIAKLKEVLKKDISQEFEEKEEKSMSSGNMDFLISNDNNFAVQVEREYNEELDEITYTINEEWAS